MKKIFISLTLLISLSLVAIVATSMTEAIIDEYYCSGCGNCWNYQEHDAFSEYFDGTAWWGIYQTGEFGGLRYYCYPSSEHVVDISEMKELCPGDAIMLYISNYIIARKKTEQIKSD